MRWTQSDTLDAILVQCSWSSKIKSGNADVQCGCGGGRPEIDTHRPSFSTPVTRKYAGAPAEFRTRASLLEHTAAMRCASARRAQEVSEMVDIRIALRQLLQKLFDCANYPTLWMSRTAAGAHVL